LEPVELSKHGALYSYTIVRVPPAGWPGPVPYILGQVELPEGPQVLAEVVNCLEADLRIGMAVELALQIVRTGPPLTPPSQGGERGGVVQGGERGGVAQGGGGGTVAQGRDGAVVVYKWKPEQPGLEYSREEAK
jgi:hypothetical protein